jgi:hypothetical protein
MATNRSQSTQNAPANDLVQSLDRLTAAAQLSTQANRTLRAPASTPAIPPRIGVGYPEVI